MTTRRRYAAIDRLTPEQVHDFKLAALEAGRRTLAAGVGPVVIAEGDSWFDYPLGTDLIDCLRRHHGLSITNHARAGDTLENMVYGARFSPLDGYRPLPAGIAAVLDDLARTRSPVLLFSGGGNDIAGEEFAQFLNHAASGLEPFRRDHAREIIDVVFRRLYSDLIARIAEVSPRTHIFTHGYGYPVADGRGVGIAIGISFIGPWLRPALAAKRIDPAGPGAVIIRELIDMFNDLLMSLDAANERFHYVDLRAVIGDRRDAWANELHLRNSVYAAAADAIAASIRRSGALDEAAPLSAAAARRPAARPNRPARATRRARRRSR